MGFPRNDYLTAAREQKHSENFISETLRYADELDGKGLPVIFDQQHLSYLMYMDYCDLKALVRSVSDCYKYFAIKKRQGGLRRIMSPYSNLRDVQVWIKENILDRIEQPNYVTAFVKGRNIVENARMHERRKYILKVDIANFFESIRMKQVYVAFKMMGYDKSVASWLASLCTAKIVKYKYEKLNDQEEVQKLFKDLCNNSEPFLVQGSPTSPGLANIICKRMDKRMMGFADKHGITYSRYADDMTFSADEKNRLPKVSLIRKIVETEGFHLKGEKTELLHEGNRQIVTGLLVDDHVRVPGRYKKDIKRHLHFCLKYGGREHFRRIAPDKAFGKEWLAGRIRYVQSVEPEAAKKLWSEFEKIDWVY